MKIVKDYLKNGQYITEEHVKTSIFLHHTAGTTASGAKRWWDTTPDRVGTPFIIDRDGTVIECFDPKYWAYHLGISGDDNYHEKCSVNIELVSAGRLRKEEDRFMFYPLWPNRTRGTEIDKIDVIKLKDEWRGNLYYHSYTSKQLKSLRELLFHIYDIFPTIPPPIEPKTFFEYDESVISNHLGGIWSHSTVRKDKDDIYPDRRLIKVLQTVKSGLSFSPIDV